MPRDGSRTSTSTSREAALEMMERNMHAEIGAGRTSSPSSMEEADDTRRSRFQAGAAQDLVRRRLPRHRAAHRVRRGAPGHGGRRRPGHDVLDVATGSGNVAILARAAGRQRDGSRPHAGAVRRRPPPRRGGGVECEWVEGDAEELPYPDDSFDRVLSTFGTMFAPRHERAAAELVRVTRPGGTIAVAAWTPEGGNGQMFKTVGSHMPPPPPDLKPPTLWGTEQHMRELFEPHGVELDFERGSVDLRGGVAGGVARLQRARRSARW